MYLIRVKVRIRIRVSVMVSVRVSVRVGFRFVVESKLRTYLTRVRV